MTNILTECANKIVDKLMNLTIAEAGYFCCFKCIVEDFEKEKEELKAKWTTVGKDVADAKRRADDIRNDVTFWQEQAEKLIEEDTKTKMTCFLGRCPNCIWRYRRGKELAQKTHEIKGLKGTNFESVGRAPNLPGVEDRPSQGYIHFESRDSKYTELLDALEDDNNYMTGLQGMGGSGKTTMATEVGKKLKESNQFDHVIFTTVSNAPDVKKIQDEIAAPFSLELKEKSESERHKILWKALTNGSKILIILDDVWEQINFYEIGIPTSDNHNGCKVLLTTRNVRVCHSMECHRIIQLELLSEQDSWTLFKKHAGISDNSSKNLQDKGQDIAKECKGLPVAIAAIASTLKGQSLVEWDAALNALQDSMPMHDVHESLKEVYKCLRYSYNNMKSETAKGLFLLCSVFPEDEEIPIEILTRYGTGLGLFGEVDKYDKARSQVVVAKNKLVDSCLLLEAEEGCVKMHDLVREVALWIANKEIQVVMLSDKKQKALVGKEKNIRYLFCEGKDMDIFSSWFDATKLKILLVYIDQSHSVDVPDAFFQKMTELRVLRLSGQHWPAVALSLPQSIQSLMNIRSLFLESWILGDISILGTLRSLETLDLGYCSISELPNKITELEKLRLLNLNKCEIERNNPFEVIERCLSLEELYFIDNEVSSLDSVKEAEAIDQNRTTFPALQRYHLDKDWKMDDSISRCVCLRNVEAFVSEATFKYLVRRAEILQLDGIKGEWRNLIPEIVPMEDEGMNDLVELGLESCSKVQCLIDTKHVYSRVRNVFSKLVGLKLKHTDSLEELCSGPYPLDFLKSLERLRLKQCEHLQSILIKSKLNLCNLKIMKLDGCPMLASLFQQSTARSLVLLEKLEICECEQLINIITDERSGDEKGEEIVDVDNDYKSCGSMFPKLKSLEIRRCHRLEFVLPVIFSGDVPLLETIKISDCGKMKYIFGRYQHEDQDLHQEVKDVVLGSLKEMVLSRLPNFIDIFPECYHAMSSSMKKSSSRYGSKTEQSDPNKRNIFPWSHICCYAQKYKPKLRSATSTNIQVVSKDGLPDCSIFLGLQTSNSDCLYPFESAQCLSKQSQILRNIREIELHDLQEIKSIFVLSIAPTMFLEILRIKECHGLKHITIDIGDDHVGNDRGTIFPKLKELSIKDCGQLEYIVGQYSHDHHNYDEIHIHLPTLENLSLENLPNVISVCPKSHRVTWPSMKKFYLTGCPQLTFTSISDIMDDLEARQLDLITTTKGLQTSNSECLHPFGSAQCLFKQSQILRNIREIKLKDVQMIKSLLILSIAPTMLLEDLIIEECHELKHIITDIGDDQDGNDWGTIFPKLKMLSVKDCSQLEYIFGQRHDDHQNFNEIHIHLPSWEELCLQDLPNVISVFPKSHRVTWPSMKKFHLTGCPQFRVTSTSDITDDLDTRQLDLITTTKGLQTSNSECLHPFRSAQCLFKQSQILRNIREIKLKDVQMIKSLLILSIAPTMLLEDLIIEECHELKHIITDSGDDQDGNDWGTIFPKLKMLSVKDCSQLEYIFGQRHDDHQNFNEIHIHLPSWEKLRLQDLPNVISVFPKSHRVMWPSMKEFHLIRCPQFRVRSTSDITDDLDTRQLDLVTTRKDLRGIVKHFHALENLNVKNSKVESIFRLDELQVIGLQMSLGLKYLTLENLPQMTYIYVGPKNSLTLQNLKQLRIVGSGKLEVIFPASILRCLPQLATLAIEECKELKQIIEEDVESQKLSNLPSPQPCFPNLTVLVVRKCNKLKRLISVSASNELPKLRLLVIDEASELEDVFGCEQGDAIGGMKVVLPKPKILIFTQLPSLCRGIAFQTVRYRFVHNCPKLSLTSNTTPEALKRINIFKEVRYWDLDDYWTLIEVFDRITREDASNQGPAKETTTEVEATSSSELPSSQVNTNLSMQAACNQNDNGIESGESVSMETITKGTPDQEFSPIASLNLIKSNEESEKEFVGKVPGSEIPDIATSQTNSELIRGPSPIPLDIPLHETHSHELVDEQLMGESCLMIQQQPLRETQITIEIPQENNCLKEAEDQSIQESSRSEKTITAILPSDSEKRNTSPIPLLPSLEKCIKRGVEERSTSENAKIVTSSFHSEPPSSLSGQLVTSQHKTCPQSIKRGVEEGSTLENANPNNNGIQSDEFIFVETITKRTLDQEFSHNASPNLAESNEESEKVFVGKVPGSEIPDMATSPTNSELIRGPSRSPLDIPLHETHTHELGHEQLMGELCLMIQQQPLRETQIAIEIPQGNNCLKEAEDQSAQESSRSEKTITVILSSDSETRNTSPIIKRGVEEGTTSENAKIVTSSTRSEPPSSLSGQLVSSQRITYPHSENMLSQTETFTNKEREGDPMSIQDFGNDGDLISLFQSMEEDGDDQIPTPSVSVVATEHLATKDNFVAKVLTDLEVSLKMPLKDIASSEANSLRILTPLKFLSRLLLEDVTLSDGLKATIDSLHQEFPSILCSFKQAFATTNKFAMLEDKEKTIKEELAQKKKAAITIVSKISKAKKFMDEAQQKKAISKEQIIRLEKEIKDCEADISSLQEEKKKCVAETIGYKKDFETVRKDKSQMVEDQRKAQHELYEIDYKWSSLCSQFELNRIATRNLS